jgi:hypothetical protein
MKPNLWEYILALISAYPGAAGVCGIALLAIAGIRLHYRKYILEELKKSNTELAELRVQAHREPEYVAFEERRPKNFIHEYNNWWKLKNLSITIGLGFVGLALITVPLVDDIIIKGNAERIWSLLGGLLAFLVAYLVVEEAQKKFSQLEKFFTEMKIDIGELKEQNIKLIEAISDLNHRLQQSDYFNKRI